MMIPLDARLNNKIDELEVQFDCKLDREERSELIEGISVGYSAHNTFEKAVELMTQRLESLLNAQTEVG